MASEENQDNPGEDEDKPPSETMLEKQRDPDEAAFAEQAIQSYAQWVLDIFRANADAAFDNFSAWVMGQDPAVFNNAAHFETIAQASLKFVGHLCGHAHSPVGQVLAGQVAGIVDQAVRQESEAPQFIEELRRATRDASWYLRDNLQAVLAGHWDKLRDLAYEGSTDFIPVIHHLGLPAADWSSEEMTHKLKHSSEAYAKTVPKQQEEAVAQQDGGPKEEQAQAGEESKEMFQEEAKEQVA